MPVVLIGKLRHWARATGARAVNGHFEGHTRCGLGYQYHWGQDNQSFSPGGAEAEVTCPRCQYLRKRDLAQHGVRA